VNAFTVVYVALPLGGILLALLVAALLKVWLAKRPSTPEDEDFRTGDEAREAFADVKRLRELTKPVTDAESEDFVKANYSRGDQACGPKD
jgi:hypothetical protein